MISVGLRLGVDNYYHYFEQFGLKQRTGIDLPGEAGTIMHKKEDMGNVELATVAFGQSFQITAIQLLTTASSIINGGNRITPHFGIEALTRDGEVEETFSYPVQTGIVSEETSATMRYILEMVVAEGSGRNGQVQGFRVGGKTATSQTLPRGSGRYLSGTGEDRRTGGDSGVRGVMAVADFPRDDVENNGKKKVPADENLTKSADATLYNVSEGGV